MDPALRGRDDHSAWLPEVQTTIASRSVVEQVLPVGVLSGVVAEQRTGMGAGVGRDVAHRGHREAVGQLAQVGQVHHLRDQPASDDADPDALHQSRSSERRARSIAISPRSRQRTRSSH